jgi:hypothetical protein
MVSLALRGTLDRHDDGAGRGSPGTDSRRHVITPGSGDGISMEEAVDRIVTRPGSAGGPESGLDGEGLDDLSLQVNHRRA